MAKVKILRNPGRHDEWWGQAKEGDVIEVGAVQAHQLAKQGIVRFVGNPPQLKGPEAAELLGGQTQPDENPEGDDQ